MTDQRPSDDTERVWYDDDYTSNRSYGSTFTSGQAGPSNEGGPESDPNAVRRLVREEIRRNYRPKGYFWKVVLGAILGALIGSGSMWFYLTGSGAQDPGQETATTQGSGANITIKPAKDVTVERAVAQKATPSVVGITTVTANSQFNQYFTGQRYAEGVGSGVVITHDGYILTNSHVISDGDAVSISVLFSDESSADAQLLWSDSTLDLAIIKVDKTGLVPVELGDSDTVAVGDKAIAIGNPLGLDLQSTLTSGYISGLDRTVNFESGLSMQGMLQTDAAINGGNSGGALLNAQGQLIGINTAKAGSSDGIGFAIPINTAKPIIDGVMAEGKFELVSLGITGIDAEIYQQYTREKLDTDSGIVVTQVFLGSAAESAGLARGDIITHIGEDPVDGMSAMKKVLLKYKVGDKVQLTLVRSQEEAVLDLTFTQTSDETAKQYEENRSSEGSQRRSPQLDPFWFLR